MANGRQRNAVDISRLAPSARPRVPLGEAVGVVTTPTGWTSTKSPQSAAQKTAARAVSAKTLPEVDVSHAAPLGASQRLPRVKAVGVVTTPTGWTPTEAAQFAAQKAAALLRILATDKKAKAGFRFVVSLVGTHAIKTLGLDALLGLTVTPGQMGHHERRHAASEVKAKEPEITKSPTISRKQRRQARSAAFKVERAARQAASETAAANPLPRAAMTGTMPAHARPPPPSGEARTGATPTLTAGVMPAADKILIKSLETAQPTAITYRTAAESEWPTLAAAGIATKRRAHGSPVHSAGAPKHPPKIAARPLLLLGDSME